MSNPTPQKKKQPKVDLEVLQNQINELTEALQRERADSMNLRRRHDDQINVLRDIVKTEVVKGLLPVVDNFERSLKHVPAELEKNDYIQGIKGIVKQFNKYLEDLGVVRIQTVGQIFDPRVHEAVSMEDGDGSHEIVIEELQPGFILGDQVIRHAMVKVKMGEVESNSPK